MEKQSYLNELSRLLEVKVEALTDDFLLQTSQLWDSLSMISTVALIDNFYHLSIKGDEIEQCVKLGDVFSLIEQKLLEKNRIESTGR